MLINLFLGPFHYYKENLQPGILIHKCSAFQQVWNSSNFYSNQHKYILKLEIFTFISTLNVQQ